MSKYLAEKAAWDWHKDKPQIRMTTICPSFVLGPPHSARTDSTSVITVVEMLNGTMKEKGCSNGCFGAIDIRNVGQAHVACFENPKATGRYLVTSEVGYAHLELVAMLKGEFGNFPLPDKQNGEIASRPKMSHQKAHNELGINFIPMNQTMVDMANSLVKFGLVKAPSSDS